MFDANLSQIYKYTTNKQPEAWVRFQLTYANPNTQLYSQKVNAS